MNHTPIIESIFDACSYSTYLELGIYDGSNLDVLSRKALFAIGVDIYDLRLNKTLNFYLGTTRDFFSTQTRTYDMIFIDADHNYESVKLDLFDSLKVLNKNGTIILHDTDPISMHYTQSGYCGDSYKINDFLKHSLLDFVTLPINECGLTIVRKNSDLRYKNFIYE